MGISARSFRARPGSRSVRSRAPMSRKALFFEEMMGDFSSFEGDDNYSDDD
ncbi:MAG: hypothetical protein ACLVJK_08615 [Alistipes putredinis]